MNTVETRGYDALNREVTSTVSGAGMKPLTTQTAYDLDGNVAQVQQPDGDAIVNSYDLADQLTDTETDAGPVGTPTHTTYEHYDYDNAGNLYHSTDFDTRDHTTTYDGDNRSVQALDSPYLSTPTLTTTVGYDPDANVITRTLQQVGQTHTYTATYNAADWRTSMAEDGVATSYGYDAAGQVRTQTLKTGTSGVPLTRVLDPAGRTTALGEGTAPYTTTFGYNADNLPLTITLPGGVQETTGSTGYDAGGRLTHVGASGPATATSVLSSSYDYGYSPLGWTSAVTTTLNGVASTQVFTHDALGRLTGIVGGQSWTYDANDNSSTTVTGTLTTTYGYGGVPNELLTVSAPGQPTTYYAYDKDGHTTSITNTGTISTSLGYDSRGRLATVTLKDGTQVSMGYTPSGQRASYSVSKGGVTSLSEQFRYRGGELGQAVVTGSSVTPYTDTYVYNATGGPLELLRQQSGSTSRYWDVLDGRGSVVALTDVNGSVVDRYADDPLGEVLAQGTSQSVSERASRAAFYRRTSVPTTPTR